MAGFVCVTAASEPVIEYGPLPPKLVAVPQTLLNLVHAPEVQEQLGLSEEKLAEWEDALRETDALWWPGRILPPTEQRAIAAAEEAKLVVELERIAGADAVKRLRQIELQSQGIRVLARPEVQKYTRLNAKQRQKLDEIFSENDRIVSALASTKPPLDADKLRSLKDAKATEPKRALAVLTAAQAALIPKALGEKIDTAKLKRIYPFAPELIDSGYWSGKEKLTLESLKGQVVLIHFYAFQCHNCVANFGHYKRWDESLRSRGIRLIGIQTPETPAERDPEKVTAAAKKEGFQFPVLIDVENKNWDAWGNTMWPTVYVIDKKGYIRFWWQGELNWEGATVDQQIEAVIEELAKE